MTKLAREVLMNEQITHFESYFFIWE